MAAPAIGVRPRWTPRMWAEIDRGHPLAQSLIACIVRNRSLLAPVTSNTMIPSPGTLGDAIANNGNSTELAVPYPLPAGPWTHMAVVTVTTVAATTAMSVYETGNVANSDRFIGIRSNNWSTYIFDGAAKNAAGPAAAVGPAVVIATSSGTSLQCWANGVPGTATATSNAGFGYSSNPTSLNLGRCRVASSVGYGALNVAFTGVIHMAASWDRVLSTAAVQMLSADPFCFLRS